MFGAIVGDIAGSTYEHANFKFESCEIFRADSRFTDDTVLTLATADHFVFGESYRDSYRRFGRNYPYAGYGGNFFRWMLSDNPLPYHSCGNGSAMRASPIAWAVNDLSEALQEAKQSAVVTHDHPNGIKGAQALVASVFLARQGAGKDAIRTYIATNFAYNLERSLASIRPAYRFDVSCEASVPEAIIAFLESNSFEDALRKAISLGGDSDTIASITGAIAHAHYGSIPEWMTAYCLRLLDPAQRSILNDFWTAFPASSV